MKSSFSRSFFTAATILLLALSVLGAAFQLQVNNYMEDTTVAGLQQDSAVIANLAAAYSLDGNLSSRELLLNLDIISQVTDADVVICDQNGFIVLCSDALTGCDHEGWQVNQEYLQSVYTSGHQTATGIIQNLYDDERFVVASPILNGEVPKGIVIVSTPTAATNQMLNRISNIFLTASVFVVLLAVLAVTAFARRESRPLRDMAKVANAFAHGNLKARVRLDDDYSMEMEELALAFNNMALSLQKSEYQRQEFVANVSHELKTPMTTISGFVDGILDGTIPPERQKRYLETISSETKRLSRLVRSMLELSRLQAEDRSVLCQKSFDIAEVLRLTLINFAEKINAQKLDVDFQVPEDPMEVLGDVDAITQVVYNLLDNAVKYTEEGSVTLSVQGEESNGDEVTLKIKVADTGIGIRKEDMENIYDSFNRIDEKKNAGIVGSGLGLSIARDLAKLQDGLFEITVDGDLFKSAVTLRKN
mgnify:CR=1 FL=1